MYSGDMKPAGFWIRFFAKLLDQLLIILPLAHLFVLVLNKDLETTEYVFSLLYYLLLPVIWSGYTVGKRFVGIRIVKVDGTDVHLGNMLLREVISQLIYYLTFGIALVISGLLVIFREDKRALHDLLAGTCVVYRGDE